MRSGSLAAVGGQVAGATNRTLGMPPGAPLFERHVSAVRLRAERALSVIDLPALPVLHRLLNRTVPGATTLDRGRTFPEVTGPSELLQLDRAGLGAVAPSLYAQQLPLPGEQVGFGLLVRLVLLLGLAGLAFAVGGTVGLLPGDLVRLLRLLVLLTHTTEVASSQEPRRAALQTGDQVAGLLPATGRLRQLLLVLLSPLGRMGEQPRLVAWCGVDHAAEPSEFGTEVVLAHAPRVHGGGGVGGEPLAAVPPRHRGELVGLVLGGAVGGGHVQGVALGVAVAAGGLGVTTL